MRKILWIDDQKNRQVLAGSIAESLAVMKECVEYVEPGKIDSITTQSRSGYVAIFVDHYLTQDEKLREAGKNKGASWCSRLRVCCPDVPIFGISAASVVQIRQSERFEYDYFATADKYKELIASGRIRAAVEGFLGLKMLVNRKRTEGDKFIAAVLKCLDVPSQDVTMMKKLLPSCLRSRETYDIHRAYQWMSKKFMCKDGVLVGSNSLAAMIGLKNNAFVKKIKPKLLNCCYKGVFSFGDDLFWRSKVFETLANLTKNDGSIPLSHYCENLEDVVPGDYAECPKCHQKYTEVLALADRTPDAETFPAHRNCVTEIEEGQSLFFESDYLIDE